MRVTPVVGVGIALAAGLPVSPATGTGAMTEPGIVVLNVTGSGCRPNTTAAALSPDRNAITITYAEYLASSAGAVSRNCRINLKINPVPGYAPAVTSVDYRGFADLVPASDAQLTASYGFHGATHVESAALRLAGPFSDDWETTDAPEGGLVTGRCAGSNVLDIDSTLKVTAGPAGATTDFIAMDSTDGAVPNTFHVAWRRCS